MKSAIKELRRRLGLTQQELAVSLNRALTTVARWETSRPPKEFMLIQLAEFALRKNEPDLAEIFRAAAGESFRQPNEIPFSKEHPTWTDALLALLNSHVLRSDSHVSRSWGMKSDDMLKPRTFGIPDEEVFRVYELFKQLVTPLRIRTQGSSAIQAKALESLAIEAVGTYGELWKVTSAEFVLCAAALVRRLLEIAVWTEYCAESRANADRFTIDAVRDANAIRRNFRKLVDSVKMSGGLKYVCRLAKIEELDAKHWSVAEVAKQISPDTDMAYRTAYEILSALVHPIAIPLKSLSPPEIVGEWTSGLLRLGTALVLSILEQITNVTPTLTSEGDGSNFTRSRPH